VPASFAAALDRVTRRNVPKAIATKVI